VILLWGVPGDGPFDAVRSALQQRHAEFRLLDQRDAVDIGITFRIGVDGTLDGTILDAGEEVALARVGSAYIRPVETSKACSSPGDDDPDFLRAVAVDACLVAWADLARTTVVNRPCAMASNNSKPYQLALIAGAGFLVPDTLVTTDPGAVVRFQKRHGTLLYKPSAVCEASYPG
jgi:hypothetical protein